MQCDYKTNDLQFVQKYYRLQKRKKKLKTKQDKERNCKNEIKEKTIKVGNKFCIQARILTHTKMK